MIGEISDISVSQGLKDEKWKKDYKSLVKINTWNLVKLLKEHKTLYISLGPMSKTK